MESSTIQGTIAKLDLHFKTEIMKHPTANDNDYRSKSLSEFNELINQYKPESLEEKSIAIFLQDSFAINNQATVEFLRRTNQLGLCQFINGHAIAIALGINRKLYISTDGNNYYTASASDRRPPMQRMNLEDLRVDTKRGRAGRKKVRKPKTPPTERQFHMGDVSILKKDPTPSEAYKNLTVEVGAPIKWGDAESPAITPKADTEVEENPDIIIEEED